MSDKHTPQDNKPAFGQKAVRQSCDRDIQFNGRHWEHVGEPLCHPASPAPSPASGGEQQGDTPVKCKKCGRPMAQDVDYQKSIHGRPQSKRSIEKLCWSDFGPDNQCRAAGKAKSLTKGQQ